MTLAASLLSLPSLEPAAAVLLLAAAPAIRPATWPALAALVSTAVLFPLLLMDSPDLVQMPQEPNTPLVADGSSAAVPLVRASAVFTLGGRHAFDAASTSASSLFALLSQLTTIESIRGCRSHGAMTPTRGPRRRNKDKEQEDETNQGLHVAATRQVDEKRIVCAPVHRLR